MHFKTRFSFFKGTWTIFCGPFISFRVSFAVSLCSPGSDKVVYNWKVWRRLCLFGGFEFWKFFFFLRWVFCSRDELSITELWDGRREKLGLGNLSRIWWRAWKRHRTPCALQAGGSTWLKFICSPETRCISPGCAWVVSFRREGESLEHSKESMYVCSHQLLIQPQHIPLRFVESLSGCKTELCQQKTPWSSEIEADFAVVPREVAATIPGGMAEVCERGAEGPWQCWFMIGLDFKDFFQPKQLCDSADKHWVGCFAKLSFGYFSSGHQTQFFCLQECSMPDTISVESVKFQVLCFLHHFI